MKESIKGTHLPVTDKEIQAGYLLNPWMFICI